MIAFATLFLGLTLGLQPVELVASDEVAAVEILLGGRSLGVIEGPPWTLEVDFGSELAPQLLEAVALDAGRRELSRTRQYVNLPHPPVELSVVLDGPAQAPAVRLAWESVVGIEPRSVTASLDGVQLTVEDPRRIPLPPGTGNRTHLFSAELLFDNDVSSRVTLAYGGTYLDQVSTELTGIPVFFAGGRRKAPPVEAVGGWFESRDGRPLEVAAIEEGPEELIFVLTENLNRRRRQPRFPKTAVLLAEDQAVRFVLPTAEQRPGVAKKFNFHPISEEYRRRDGGLYSLLTGLRFHGDPGRPQFADAVAVAGLTAYERQRRRAVVLVLGSKTSAGGLITPRQSRRYLEHLKVPFFVWTVDPDAAGPTAWGTPVDASNYPKLRKAFAEVSAAVDRQWIVWLDGVHLPQNIRLSPAAEGIRLAPDSRWDNQEGEP